MLVACEEESRGISRLGDSDLGLGLWMARGGDGSVGGKQSTLRDEASGEGFAAWCMLVGGDGFVGSE